MSPTYPTLTDVRAALKATLAREVGLNAYDYVMDVVQSPAAVVEPAGGNFKVSMHSGEVYAFSILVLAKSQNIVNAQKILDQYLTGRGDKSIRALLFGSDLGIDGLDCFAEGWKDYNGSIDIGPIQYIGANMRVRVTVT